MEGARAGDRLAFLSGRDFVAPLRKFAFSRCAHHGLQSVRAPDFARWRSEQRGASFSIRGENKKTSRLAKFPLRHGRAANPGEQSRPISPGGKTAMMAKLTVAYQKMSQRERIMTLAVAGILFLLVNLFVWRWLLGTIGTSRRELASRKATRSEQTVYMKERDLWARRDQ